MDNRSAQVFPYNIFTYCSICRVDCKFARNKKKYVIFFTYIKSPKIGQLFFSESSICREGVT
jgi:hypothetical protein